MEQTILDDWLFGVLRRIGCISYNDYSLWLGERNSSLFALLKLGKIIGVNVKNTLSTFNLEPLIQIKPTNAQNIYQ